MAKKKLPNYEILNHVWYNMKIPKKQPEGKQLKEFFKEFTTAARKKGYDGYCKHMWTYVYKMFKGEYFDKATIKDINETMPEAIPITIKR